MKKILLLCFVLASLGAKGQTYELEKKYINDLRNTNEVLFKEKAAKWSNFLKEIGEYPALPYNDTLKSFMYQKVIQCPNLSKKEIMSRLKEWVSLNYGSYGAVVDYHNDETGKLITKGFVRVYQEVTTSFLFFNAKERITKRLYNTYVFTAKDNVLKVEIVRNVFEDDVPFAHLFPILAQNSNDWVGLVKMLKYANDAILFSFADIDKYVNGKEEDYKF